MVIRVRDKARPGDPSKDIDLGPNGHAIRHPWVVMRRTIDEALIAASAMHRREVSR